MKINKKRKQSERVSFSRHFLRRSLVEFKSLLRDTRSRGEGPSSQKFQNSFIGRKSKEHTSSCIDSRQRAFLLCTRISSSRIVANSALFTQRNSDFVSCASSAKHFWPYDTITRVRISVRGNLSTREKLPHIVSLIYTRRDDRILRRQKSHHTLTVTSMLTIS